MTSLRWACGLVLVTSACAGAHIGSESDAGAPDGSVPGPDAGPGDGGNVCAELLATVTALVSNRQTCQTTADCLFAHTACGLPGVCGAIVNPETAAGLTLPVTSWIDDGCASHEPGTCPDCPAFDELPICQGGLCAAEPGAGEPCQSATDCPMSSPDGGTECLTDSPFSGGYCVQPCEDGWGCQTYNLSCRTLPPGSAPGTACFLSCGSDSECRVDAGYLCCPDWNDGGFAAIGGVCYPGPCPN